MNGAPSVRRIVLFKQGLAHIDRRGSVGGGFDLLFDRAELGEVLRSLTVWIERGDGHVTALAFDAPEDPDAALAGRKLRFEQGTTLRGMLQATRGRRVRIESSEGTAEGELLGFEESTSSHGARRWLLLRTGLGQIGVFDLAAIRTLDFGDGPVRGSFDLFVDRSRASARGDARTVHVALDKPAEDVRVLYVVPATPFVISYRLACNASDARLFAFALVHNPLEEDLDRVELVLSTKSTTQGSSSHHGSATGRSHDIIKPDRGRRRVSGQPHTVRAPVPISPAVQVITSGKTLPPKTSERTVESNEVVSTSGDVEIPTGGLEAAEWRASEPISLRRRSAAMVPICATTVAIRKERHFRDATSEHPDLMVCFDNQTATMLEEGRCAVYDLGRYLGETTLPHTTPGGSVQLTFSKDSFVRRSRTTHKTSFLGSLEFRADGIDEHEAFEERQFVTIRSDHSIGIEVVLDFARLEGRTVTAEGQKPISETGTAVSFRLHVPAGGEATLNVCESWKQARRVPFEGLEQAQIENWRRAGLLRTEQYDALLSAVQGWEEARHADAQWSRLEREMLDLFSRQSKVTDQLAVLREGGTEGMLRTRFVSELESAQQRILAIDAEMQTLRARAAEGRKIAQQLMMAGVGKATV